MREARFQRGRARSSLFSRLLPCFFLRRFLRGGGARARQKCLTQLSELLARDLALCGTGLQIRQSARHFGLQQRQLFGRSLRLRGREALLPHGAHRSEVLPRGPARERFALEVLQRAPQTSLLIHRRCRGRDGVRRRDRPRTLNRQNARRLGLQIGRRALTVRDQQPAVPQHELIAAPVGVAVQVAGRKLHSRHLDARQLQLCAFDPAIRIAIRRLECAAGALERGSGDGLGLLRDVLGSDGRKDKGRGAKRGVEADEGLGARVHGSPRG